ncbi:hypothetical protein [Halovenus halobia]|uniref:hypothetical protein n=1 Tax=Halovenus halobia TaxID=3396622 RepID=UPI003F55C5F6
MSPLSNHDSSERQTTQSRRRFLLGVGAATAALAGCASSDESDDDEPADDSETDSFDPASDLSYGQWLTTAADGMLFAYANLEAAPANDESGGSLNESLDDPLATYPLVMSQTIVGLGQLRLSFAGLTQALTPQAESESTVNEIIVINQTTVAQGTFATDRLAELLTEQTDETWGIAYEQTQTLNGYDQYEPAEVPDSFSSEPPVIAVADESVVVSADVAQLERMVTAGDDGQPRIYESNDTVTQLLEQAGSGDLVVGKIGTLPDDAFNGEEMFETDPQFEPQSGEDVVAAVDFGGDSDTVDSQFALAAEDIAESRQETVETTFGTAAVDESVSVDVSDDRITASGTYSIESLGLTSGDGSRDEELSQTEAAELVSPDSLAFQYEPLPGQQFGELWVEVTEETDAAAIRLETDSGNYTEIRPQGRSVSAHDSVAVQVDPDGDSVTVFAVNDEGAVGELTTQSVPTESLSETAANQAVPTDAVSFNYDSPDAGDFGSLTIEVVANIEAETLVAQPQEAPGVFADRVGSIGTGESVDVGTTLETAVEPEGDTVIVYGTVDNATGEVARWQGPD